MRFGPSLLHLTHLGCVLPVMDMMTCCLCQRWHAKETLQFCSHPYWSWYLVHSRDQKVVATLQRSETESSGWENKQKHTLLYLEELWPFEFALSAQQKIISCTSRLFQVLLKQCHHDTVCIFFCVFLSENGLCDVVGTARLQWNRREPTCYGTSGEGLLAVQYAQPMACCLSLSPPSCLSVSSS